MKYILLWVVVVIGCILLDKWLFSAVMGTNWPDWVKYLILR